jgi:hypothetical protein
MLPTLTLIAVAAAFMGMLNSLHHYFIPALSPAMFNVLTIVCAFALVPLMPAFGLHPIAAIAIGTLLGGVAQLAVQWPTLHKEGFRYHLDLDWRDEGLRRMLTMMGPGAVGMAATQVNVFVNTVLATSTGRRRGVVAELRVSPDVSADRSVRCVDCDGRVTDGIAPEHAAGFRRRARDRHQQPVADAHAEHPSHRRTRGAGRNRSFACCSNAAASRQPIRSPQLRRCSSIQ